MHPVSRRDFVTLSTTALALLGLTGCASLVRSPRKPRPIAPGAKIRIAQIGCGGKGFSDIAVHADEDVVALCDIEWDLPQVQELFKKFPNAKRYRDFRKMLTEMDDQIDAVCISTPDHMPYFCVMCCLFLTPSLLHLPHLGHLFLFEKQKSCVSIPYFYQKITTSVT